MLNWRDAIKNAQQKIDKVLDIRSEPNETVAEPTETGLFGWTTPAKSPSPRTSDRDDNVEELNIDVGEGDGSGNASSNPSSDPGDSVVKSEPMLPPFVPSERDGTEDCAFDEAMTFVSSDLEVVHLGEERSEAEHPIHPSKCAQPSSVPNFNELRKQNEWLNVHLHKARAERIELKKNISKLIESKLVIEADHESLKNEATKLSSTIFEAQQEKKRARKELAVVEQKYNDLLKKDTSQTSKIATLEETLKELKSKNQELSANYSSQSSKAQEAENELAVWKEKWQSLDEEFRQQRMQHEQVVGMEKMAVSFESNYYDANNVANKQELLELHKKNESLQSELRLSHQRIEQLETKQSALLSESIAAATIPLNERLDKLTSQLEATCIERDAYQQRYKTINSTYTRFLEDLSYLKSAVASLSSYYSLIQMQYDEDIKRITHMCTQHDKAARAYTTKLEKALVKANTRPETDCKTTQTDSVARNEPDNEVLPELTQDRFSPVREAQNFQRQGSSSQLLAEKLREVEVMREVMRVELDRLRQGSQDKENIRRCAEMRKREYENLLVLYGEKLERLEELQADNDELRQLLREQALAHTAEGGQKRAESNHE